MNKHSILIIDYEAQLLKSLAKLLDDEFHIHTAPSGRNYEWTRRCADLSVHGFIEKPFDPDELIKRINKILSAKKGTRIQEILEDEFDKKKTSLNPIFAKTISYIEDNFPKELSRENIAAKLEISPQYLSTLFKEECGLQLNEFINRCRIEKSLEFIKDNPSLQFKQVADRSA